MCMSHLLLLQGKVMKSHRGNIDSGLAWGSYVALQHRHGLVRHIALHNGSPFCSALLNQAFHHLAAT